MTNSFPVPWNYPYVDVVVGFVWSHDPESYARGSLATGRVSHTRQVEVDGPDKKGYSGPPGWGFGLGQTTPHSKKLIVTKVEQQAKEHSGL